jgi:hypothetical protein
MLKPWNRARSKLDPFQISIEYLSPIHVKICFQLIIFIPNDRFLSICSLKFYMLFLSPTPSITLYPRRFSYPSNNSRRRRPHIIHFTAHLFRSVTIYWTLPLVEFYFSWSKIAELFCPLVSVRRGKNINLIKNKSVCFHVRWARTAQ